MMLNDCIFHGTECSISSTADMKNEEYISMNCINILILRLIFRMSLIYTTFYSIRLLAMIQTCNDLVALCMLRVSIYDQNRTFLDELIGRRKIQMSTSADNIPSQKFQMSGRPAFQFYQSEPGKLLSPQPTNELTILMYENLYIGVF